MPPQEILKNYIVDALRLILRHSGGNSSHSVNVEMLGTVHVLLVNFILLMKIFGGGRIFQVFPFV